VTPYVSDNTENNTKSNDTAVKVNLKPKSDYASRFYGISDWDSLFGNTRVEGINRAWQRNPEYM
jgi:hypothetical protein